MQETPTLKHMSPTRRVLDETSRLGHGFTFVKEHPFEDLQKEPYRSHRRLSVFAHKGGECVDCGRVGTRFIETCDSRGGIHLDVYTEDCILMTVDHIFPKSKGGTEELDNKQPMCTKCNRLKAAAIPSEGQGVMTPESAAKAKWKHFNMEVAIDLSQCEALSEAESLPIRTKLFESFQKGRFQIGNNVQFKQLQNKNIVGIKGTVAAFYEVAWSEENPWGFCLDIQSKSNSNKIYKGITMRQHPYLLETKKKGKPQPKPKRK